ncbi:integrin-binding sialoprotein [Phyllobates terribilis]|uniref:integrin-binding sialoprotein n=1 Tax=Phyllobates terribilis TaxID=111132 RepID=UPI003CCAD018
MKAALIFIVLWGLSNAFYINRFQRKWKGDDSDEKGALRHRYSNNFFRRVYFQAPPKYITYAKASDSSEENEDSSDEQEESVDAGENGNNAASEETGAEESEGNGAEEEADSEGAEEENGGTSAPEVEDSTASQNETTTDDGQSNTAQESSTEVQPTQAGTIEPATQQLKETAVNPTELPKSSDYDNLGAEEGSNGGAAGTAHVYEPENNGYYDEHGYYYHENEIDPRGVKGDNYGKYEDDYHYRNHLYQLYAQQYQQYYNQ